ncbi:hypothetical protein CDIK_0445 [Cucumispora dikerogammari]|nr:hypothetical protein CDIK_0445 [Cucumispora dikerogammari]
MVKKMLASLNWNYSETFNYPKLEVLIQPQVLIGNNEEVCSLDIDSLIPHKTVSVETLFHIENISEVKKNDDYLDKICQKVKILFVDIVDDESGNKVFDQRSELSEMPHLYMPFLQKKIVTTAVDKVFCLSLRNTNTSSENPLINYLKDNPLKGFKICFFLSGAKRKDIYDILKDFIQYSKLKTLRFAYDFQQAEQANTFLGSNKTKIIDGDCGSYIIENEDGESREEKIQAIMKNDYFDNKVKYAALKYLDFVKREERTRYFDCDSHRKPKDKESILKDINKRLFIETKEFFKEKVKITIKMLNLENSLQYRAIQILNKKIDSVEIDSFEIDSLEINSLLVMASVFDILEKTIGEIARCAIFETFVYTLNENTDILEQVNVRE